MRVRKFSEFINEAKVAKKSFAVGDLTFVKDVGSKGLVGMVVSGPKKDEYGIMVCDVLFRGMSGDIIECAVEEMLEMTEERMEAAEANGDISAYKSIAKKRGIY